MVNCSFNGSACASFNANVQKYRRSCLKLLTFVSIQLLQNPPKFIPSIPPQSTKFRSFLVETFQQIWRIRRIVDGNEAFCDTYIKVKTLSWGKRKKLKSY